MRKSWVWLAVTTIAAFPGGAMFAIAVDAGVTAEEAGHVPVQYAGKQAYTDGLLRLSRHADRLFLPCFITVVVAAVIFLILRRREGASWRSSVLVSALTPLVTFVIGFMLAAWNASAFQKYL